MGVYQEEGDAIRNCVVLKSAIIKLYRVIT